MKIFKWNLLTDYELVHYYDNDEYYYKMQNERLSKENFRLNLELERLREENVNLKNNQVIKIVNLEEAMEKDNEKEK